MGLHIFVSIKGWGCECHSWTGWHRSQEARHPSTNFRKGGGVQPLAETKKNMPSELLSCHAGWMLNTYYKAAFERSFARLRAQADGTGESVMNF